MSSGNSIQNSIQNTEYRTQQKRSRPTRIKAGALTREEIIVNGIVQGIGFRPAVYALATRLKLKGCVYNDSRGVVIEVQGEQKTIDKFVEGLYKLDLNKMKIESLERTPLNPPLSGGQDLTPNPSPKRRGGGTRDVLTDSEASFVILKTSDSEAASTFMPPDLAVCEDCLADLQNHKDKRHSGFHLTACTQCGPRFTVIKKLPYQWKDTANTPYPMCEDCKAEYEKPTTRRFNFETNICAKCGPNLKLVKLQIEKLKIKNVKNKTHSLKDPIDKSIELLAEGKILAIKGVGGYHIACDACNQEAVQRLRSRKQRPHKPFAVMFPDVKNLRQYARVSKAEEDLLTSLESPIVLVNQRESRPLERTGLDNLADGVAPGQYAIGAMLPYSPLHHLIVKQPLVMTSANVSGQPMMYRDEDVFEHLAGIVDYVLYHEREIVVNVDDSIARIAHTPPQSPPNLGAEKRGGIQILRRSRGYVPEAVELPRKLEKKVLSFGPQQKNTFCLGFDNKALISQHNGDLNSLESQEAFEHTLRHMMHIFNFQPELLVCDLHPGYASTRFAERMAKERNLPLIHVQHHEAHVAGVVVEPPSNSPLIRGEESSPLDKRGRGGIIGVAFDGTGYGKDGEIWGGEFFKLSNSKSGIRNPKIVIERIAYFDYVDMPGGDYAVMEPYRMMLSYLWHAYGDRRIDEFFLGSVDNQTYAGVWELVKRGKSQVKTSSVGRLFDAISALLTGRHVTSYEGQAAMELETLARYGNQKVRVLPFDISKEADIMKIRVDSMVRKVVEQLGNGKNKVDLAMAFHKTIARIIAQVVSLQAKKENTKQVALTGGVFQNKLLSELAVETLEKDGFTVLLHHQIPMNDGGISFGQLAYVLLRGVDRE